MRIGVTGAAGYVGLRLLQLAKHEIVAIDNGYLARAWKVGDTEIQKADIRDLPAMEKAFKDVDALIHLAAITGVDACDQKPDEAFEVNVKGLANIAWLCKKHAIPLVFACSMSVYGDPEKFPITEETPRRPVTSYGYSKYAGEGIVRVMAKDSFPACTMVKSNVYGSYALEGKEILKSTVVNKFIDLVRKGQPIEVYKPGDQARNFIHVDDAARVYLLAAEKLQGAAPGAESYNLSGTQSYSILKVAEMVKKAFEAGGRDAEVKLVDNPRGSEAMVTSFDVDLGKIGNALGFRPEISLEVGIKKTLQKL